MNLGGIANLTVLDADPARVFGFDTGPANSPLDRLARRLSGGTLACDRDGQFARSGRVNEPLLAELLQNDPYLERRPPKSTGFEMYGDAFVARVAERHGGFDVDLMATLTEFVARTVALGLGQCAQLGPPVQEVVAAGGGVQNPNLMERIAVRIAPIPVRWSDELGVPTAAREAMAFAVLADMALRGQPACLPPVTGASATSCSARSRSLEIPGSIALRVVLLPEDSVDVTSSMQDPDDDDPVFESLIVDDM